MNGKEFSVYVSSDKIEKAFEECNGLGLKGKWLSGTMHPLDAVKNPGNMESRAFSGTGMGGTAEMSMPSRDKSQDLILELNASKARAAVLLDMVNKLLDKISVKI